MIKIRESTIKDVDQIASCIEQVAQERKYLANTHGFSIAQTNEFLQSLKINGGIQLIILDKEKVVGWCDIVPGFFEGLSHVGHIGMGLLNNYRGQGLGKKVLKQIIDIAFKRHFERIELEVFASNIPAIRLYEKAGFKQEGIKRNARKLDDQYDDIIFFGLLKREWQANNLS